ncbi:MAG: glycosyltransferase family 2 protein [Pyrinomonadaceae bacterium]
MPKVSVVIATHNRPHLLPGAVESARRAGTDVEVVVVDDASTDETAGICRELPGIRYVRVARNRGVACARNLGIVASGGEYIGFLDDDDLRLPGSLDAQVKTLDSAPEVGLVYGQALVGDEHRAPTGDSYPAHCPRGDVFWELLAQNFIPCGTALFRRSCLSRVGLLDETIPGIEDWDLWIRIAELCAVEAVARPLLIWRRPTPDSGQYTSGAARLLSLGARQFRERWFKLPRVAAATRGERAEARGRFLDRVADQLMWETAGDLRGGRLRRARANALTALRLNFAGTLRRAARPETLRFLLAGASGERRREGTINGITGRGE